MAAANPAKTLQDEATCSICLDYFKDPLMIIDCGHNFCRACISRCEVGADANVSCPFCRGSFPQRSLKPNRQLASLAEVAKQLSLQSAKEPGGDKVCEAHQEPLKLFCEEDQTLICVVCDRSKAHRAHVVVPIEEAAQEYKVRLQSQVEMLKKKRAAILAFQSGGEMTSQELLKDMETERQKAESQFKQLHLFLKEQEQCHLCQLSELDVKIAKRREENTVKYSEVVSYLSELVCEMEGKCHQPASEFLKDIKSTLSRCEKEKGKFQKPKAVSPNWRRRLQELSRKTTTLQDALKKLKEPLSTEPMLETANVTFDPATAHPRFVVSEDRKSVRWGDTRQDLPYSPERFDPSRSVLGCEGFTSGTHFWLVDVGAGGFWAVGVARESVRRKGGISLNPDGGVWAIGFCKGQYRALTSPVTLLSLSMSPTRITVALDYNGGLVMFMNFDTKTKIFSFPPSSFTGERIFPFFRVGDMQTHLRLLPCSAG